MKFRIVAKTTAPAKHENPRDTEPPGHYFLLHVQAGSEVKPVTVSGVTWHAHDVGQDIDLVGAFATAHVQRQVARADALDVIVADYQRHTPSRGGEQKGNPPSEPVEWVFCGRGRQVKVMDRSWHGARAVAMQRLQCEPFEIETVS